MIVRGAPTDDPAIREYAEMIVSARDEDSIYLTRAELLPMARAYLAAPDVRGTPAERILWSWGTTSEGIAITLASLPGRPQITLASRDLGLMADALRVRRLISVSPTKPTRSGTT